MSCKNLVWRLKYDSPNLNLFFNICLLQTVEHHCSFSVLFCSIFSYLCRVLYQLSTAPPTSICQTLAHCHSFSLCLHWFFYVLTSLTGMGYGIESWETVCWIENMTYLPTHFHQLTHVPCHVIFSLVNLFLLTLLSKLKKSILIWHRAITLACSDTFGSFVNTIIILIIIGMPYTVQPLITYCIHDKSHSFDLSCLWTLMRLHDTPLHHSFPPGKWKTKTFPEDMYQVH